MCSDQVKESLKNEKRILQEIERKIKRKKDEWINNNFKRETFEKIIQKNEEEILKLEGIRESLCGNKIESIVFKGEKSTIKGSLEENDDIILDLKKNSEPQASNKTKIHPSPSRCVSYNELNVSSSESPVNNIKIINDIVSGKINSTLETIEFVKDQIDQE